MGVVPAEGMQVSALPGFPAASYTYHVGATGFFLNCANHIVFITEQLAQINYDSNLND